MTIAPLSAEQKTNDWIIAQLERNTDRDGYVGIETAAEVVRVAILGVLDQKAKLINNLVNDCHAASVNAGWYHDPRTGAAIARNVPEMIALMHSELSEALEAYRKNLMDDKLPTRKGIEVELADAIIRIFDTAGYLGLDLGGAYVEKRAYNAVRLDHKPDNRAKAGGKAF